MVRKIFNAVLGLCIGVVSLPLAAVIWPAICVWYFCNEAGYDSEGPR